nr:hypothetical protein Q903MT_gene734 [Picea sitchensis]
MSSLMTLCPRGRRRKVGGPCTLSIFTAPHPPTFPRSPIRPLYHIPIPFNTQLPTYSHKKSVSIITHLTYPALPAFVPISPNSLSPSREKFIIHRGTISRTLHSLARIQFHPHYPVRIQSTHPKPSTQST